jgi:outer membrane receptor protein involved in Fe transport
MSSSKLRFTKYCGLVVFLALLLPDSAVLAQDKEELIVTGSRIPRADLTANSPIQVVTAEQLELSHTTNVEEFLRKMPQFAQAIGRNTNNGNDGSATVDLRNLGEERTLVLMDGKRFTPFDAQGFVDLAMIPGALIERVEVITGGASAVYGADAIGGVVNFITKKDFEGVELDTSYGITEEGDGEVYDFNITMGGNIDGGRGNIVFNVNFTNQAKVHQDARPFGVDALDDLLNPVGSITSPEGSFVDGGFPGDTSSNADPDFGYGQFDANGNTVDAFTTFNFNPFNLYQVPQKKWTSTFLGRYELTDNVEVFGRGSFANNRIDTLIAPSGTFGEQYSIDYNNNAYLGPDARTRWALVDAAETDPDTQNDGSVEVQIFRRLVEVGSRISQYENTAYQFVGGLRGEVLDTQHWEAFVSYGRTNRQENYLNDTTIAKTQQAMTAVVDPDTGDIVCADQSSGCAPINVFGGMMSQAGAEFIRTPLVVVDKTSMLIYGGEFGGDIPLTIPLADTPLAYVVGVERREESSSALPDDNFASGQAIGFGADSPIKSEVEVTEIFGEVRVPIVEGVPFIQSLVLEGGYRFSDYTNKVGSIENDFETDTYKFGGEWVPGGGLRLRGMFQRAVRTPSLYEIGFPNTPSTGDLDNDPCEGANPVGNAALTQLCIDTGVPPGSIGSVLSIIVGQINNFVGGKPTLQPEEADTTTVGFVWTPEFLDRLELSVDYYEIDIENVITEVSEQNTVDACYNIEKDASGQFCSLIIRNTLNGGLNGPKAFGVDISRINAGFLTVEGVDFSASYGWDIGAGVLDLGLVGTYILDNTQQDASFLPEFDCSGLVGNTCLRPSPELVFIQTTRWTQGPVSVQLVWDYIDEVTQDSLVLSGGDPADFALTKLDTQHYFHLSGNYEINDTWVVRAGIDNLLDEDPPIPGNDWGGTTENSGNTFPATYDPLGRKYWFGVKARF